MPYNVILADPPWHYENGRKESGGANLEYDTLTEGELSSLDIGVRFATPNAVLFMWATSPKLDIAIRVMEAWGFKYRTCAFVWEKLNKNNNELFVGQGYVTNQNAEFVLYGKRRTHGPHGGERIAKVERKDTTVRQICRTNMEGHSRKPDIIRERIERLYDGPYIELFARDARPGWDATGLEFDGYDIREETPYG